METEQIMEEIDKILQTSKTGRMSTGDKHTADNEYMTFHVNNYELYTEINRNSLMMEEINKSPFVYITLSNDKESDRYLEIIGKAEQVEDRGIINWWRQERNESVGTSELTVLKILVQKVKLVEEENGKKQTNA